MVLSYSRDYHPFYCLRFVVSISIGGGGRFGLSVWIDRSESCFLEFYIECRNISFPDFRPARNEFLETFFEFLEYGSGLRRGGGIGAVRNGQDAAEMLVQAGEILWLFRAGRQSVEIALRGAFQFGSLLVESSDRIRKSALPCFRGAFLQLCEHRLNLRERFEAFIHAFDGTALHFKLLAKIRKRSLNARIHLRDEQLRIALPVNGELRCVLSRRSERSQRIPRRVVHNRRNRILMRERFRRRVMNIPHESMHSRSARKHLLVSHPVHRNRMLLCDLRHVQRLVRARVLPHALIVCVANVEQIG